jgi:protein ImuB
VFVSIHLPGNLYAGEALLNLSLQFSPEVEQTSQDTVVFSIAPLRRLLGSPYQIASEIGRYGNERKLQANLAIAADPDTAILLSRNLCGVTLVTPGDEKSKLAPLSVSALFEHQAGFDPHLLETLRRWGIKTCGELADLPETGMAERMGKAGVYLRDLAAGKVRRPLRLFSFSTSYEEGMDLENSLSLLEPLLFLLGRVLGDLCDRLRAQSMAARLLWAKFRLDGQKEYNCELEFPVPLAEHQTLLKLLQLHLERHALPAPVIGFTLKLEPVEPKRLQGGIFLPPTPAPDKLQITLARISGMVGKENVGSPVLLNTHRPDAFQLESPAISNELNQTPLAQKETGGETLRLAIRLFRPALTAKVKLSDAAPQKVMANGIKGVVLRFAGPWKTSGEWWAPTAWSREEWDVALDDGALYRIYQETQTRSWCVEGIYD